MTTTALKKVNKTDSYELHSRMDAIDASFPDPGPWIWPAATAVVEQACPEHAAEILAMIIDPEQANA